METLARGLREGLMMYQDWTRKRNRTKEEIAEERVKEGKVKKRRTTRDWFLENFDSYGDSFKEEHYKPQQHPRTWSGAYCSIFFNLIFLALIAFSIFQLAQMTQTLIQGPVVAYNLNRNGNVGEFKLPTLEMSLPSTITFYEANSPSLQRIDLVDNTGFNPNLQSQLGIVPGARGVYSKGQVTLGTFNSVTQPLSPPVEGASGDIFSGEVSRAQHSFVESLKVLYLQNAVFQEVDDYYDQHAYLFVRFNADELRQLKACQLQVGLMNYGVYKALLNAGVIANRNNSQTSAAFPTLTTSAATWAQSYFNTQRTNGAGWFFTNPTRQMVQLSTGLTKEQVLAFVASTSWGTTGANITSVADTAFVESGVTAAGIAHLNDFLNWQYVIQYTPNMMTTVTNVTCDGSSTFNQTYTTASPPAVTDSSLTLTAGAPYAFPTPPFKILVQTAQAQEVMTVTAVTAPATATAGVTLAVTRPSPTALSWSGVSTFVCSTSQFSAAAPAAWACPAANYWSGDGCHCNCGAYDPDCCLSTGSTVYGCAQYQVCSYAGYCVQSLVSSLTTAQVSVGCAVGMYMPGDVVLNSYLGATSDFVSQGGGQCYPCMGDNYYDGNAKLGTDSTYYCDLAVTAVVRGYENKLSTVTTPSLSASLGTGQVLLTFLMTTQAFPTKGFPYTLVVGTGTGLSETLTVYGASALNSTSKLQKLWVGGNGAAGPKNTGSLGWLVNAGTVDAVDLIVIPNRLDAFASNSSFVLTGQSPWINFASFSTSGPYLVNGFGTQVTVTAVTPKTFRGRYPMQQLTLSAPPAGQPPLLTNLGYQATLAVAASKGDTTITITPMSWWAQTQGGTAGYIKYIYPGVSGHPTGLTGWPLLIRRSNSATTGVTGHEVVWVTSYTNPKWTCDPSWYGASDGCDCNCGVLDPDCLGSGNNGQAPTSGKLWPDSGAPIVDSSLPCIYVNSKSTCNTVCYFCTCAGACSTSSVTITTSNCAVTANNTMSLNVTTFYNYLYNSTAYPNRGLIFDHGVGNLLETPITALPNTAVTADIIKYQDFKNSDYFNIYSSVPVALSLPTTQFQPGDRASSHDPELTTSPPVLNVEVGLFSVPDRPGWSSVNLCPTVEVTNPVEKARTFGEEFAKWEILKGREMHIESCELIQQNTSACEPVSTAPRDHYNEHCIAEMPPTYAFSFRQVLPVNQKWVHEVDQAELNSRNADAIPKPIEYLIDASMVYHFSHDQDGDSAENSLGNGPPIAGDVDPTGIPLQFYGERYAHDVGASTVTYPAEAPYLNFATILQLSNAYAVSDARLLNNPRDGWAGGADAAVKLLQKFANLTITWPLDQVGGSTEKQTLPLTPGNLYVLNAKVIVQSTIFEDQYPGCGEGNKCAWYPRSITGWITQAPQVTVQRSDVDYFKRQQCEVRVVIQFVTGQTDIVKAYVYGAKEFLESIGAALALYGLAALFITLWHITTGKAVEHMVLRKKSKHMTVRRQILMAVETVRRVLGDGYRVFAKTGKTMPRELEEFEKEERKQEEEEMMDDIDELLEGRKTEGETVKEYRAKADKGLKDLDPQEKEALKAYQAKVRKERQEEEAKRRATEDFFGQLYGAIRATAGGGGAAADHHNDDEAHLRHHAGMRSARPQLAESGEGAERGGADGAGVGAGAALGALGGAALVAQLEDIDDDAILDDDGLDELMGDGEEEGEGGDDEEEDD